MPHWHACKNIALPVLALLGLLMPGAPAAQGQAVDTKAIDDIVLEALKAWEVPGAAVVIVQGDRVLYLKGQGTRRLGGKEPVTADTTFGLASCSKAFTTLALAMFVDEKKLSWDDPVRKHVPFFRLADPLADANVTVRDLLCHRTGVANHDLLCYRAPWNLEEQIRRIGKVQPSRSFRSAFQYQSIMFIAAGHAVGTASGMPWGEFVQKRIFAPLDMTGASVTTAAALKSEDHAIPHRRTKDGKIEAIPWYRFEEPNPSASVNASARDLGKWLRFQLGDGTSLGKRLVSAENLAETHMPQTIIRLEGLTRAEQPFTAQMSYGMGWVLQDYRGHALVSHAGIIDGMRTHITMVPNAQIGIAILSNLHRTRMNLALSNTLVDRLLRLPYKDWNGYYGGLVKAEEEADKASQRDWQAKRRPNTQPSQPLKAYAGTYEDPAYGTAKITLENGGLVWHWSTFRCVLEHYHYDTFTIRQEDILDHAPLVFRLGADGAVTGMRVLDVEFKKQP
jgi:CubicO group peptidase (beta-lactamase class C family)